jgi:hypothetical protein
VSEELNKYFDNKIRSIIDEIPKNNNDPLINFKKHIKKPDKYCNIKEVNYNEINKIITKMKPTNSTCNDNVSSRMIKKGKNSIIPLIMNMVNMVIKNKKFPKILKYSKIIVHFQNKLNNLDPKNMRPIHILSPLSKIIEKCWLNQMANHMTQNNLVPQQLQGGFRGRPSTTTVMNIFHKLTTLKSDKKHLQW